MSGEQMPMPAQVGWLDTLFKKIKLDKFDISTNRLIEVGMYLGAGFVAGFLLKRCATYVFVAVLTLLGLVILHQFGVVTITVDPIKMRELFGIQQTVTLDTNLLMIYWEWVKLNMALVVSFSIGLLAGLRLG